MPETILDVRVRGVNRAHAVALKLYPTSAHIPASVFILLTAYRWRVYPKDASYGIGFWRDVLFGKRVEYALHGEDVQPTAEKPRMFRRVVIDAAWPMEGWVNPFTQEEFDQLFPPRRWEGKNDPAPFDATPFDLRQWLPSKEKAITTPTEGVHQ